MSLSFAAFVPHPPIILPSIGQEQTKKVEKTAESLNLLEQELYVAKPDVIVVISPHGSLFEDSFSLNAHTSFESDLEQFGDFSTKKTWTGIPDFAAQIAHKGNVEKVPVRLVSVGKIDHGVTVPLICLTGHLNGVKILPVGYSGMSNTDHLRFGELLKDSIMDSDKRIAVVASGDLSHGLNNDAPAGFKASGAEFDQKIISLLENHNITGIAQMEDTFVKDAAECGFRSLLVLLGIIKNMNYNFKNYSYEAPFGVGYLVGNFIL